MIWYSYLKAKKKNFKSIAREKKLDSKFENKKDDGKNLRAQRGARTHDPEIKSLMLYRLS